MLGPGDEVQQGLALVAVERACPAVRLLLAHVLEGLDLDVVSAGTGQQGIEELRATHADLVTLDLTLPDLDGVEVCRRMPEFSDAYAVMITGRLEESDRLVGLDVGADDHMTKPVSPREVRARAAALLRGPRQSREREPEPEHDGVVDAKAGTRREWISTVGGTGYRFDRVEAG